MVLFDLVMKYDKSEIFHFSRLYDPNLDLLVIGAPTIKPKIYWRYLSFYFGYYPFFKRHICYYYIKVLFIIKAIEMFRNLTRGLLPLQKWLLYCSYIISIATYGFGFQLFAGVPTKTQILLLAAMECKAAFQILSVFHILPTSRIEILIDLIPIYPYLKKLAKQSYFRTTTLSLAHITPLYIFTYISYYFWLSVISCHQLCYLISSSMFSYQYIIM